MQDVKHGVTRGLTVGVLSVVPILAFLWWRSGWTVDVQLLLRGVVLAFGGAVAVGVGVNVERLEPVWRAITGALLASLTYRLLFGGYPVLETTLMVAWGAAGGIIMGAPKKP